MSRARRPWFVGTVVVVASIALSGPSSVRAQTFRRPVACTSCIGNWYYFDENPTAGMTGDWNCLTSTYDGHRGSDFSLIGGNAAIANGNDVVAAADGTVVSAMDGFYDQCTACSGTNCGSSFGFGYGNHVVINHGNYRVVYAHMRNGSIRVAAGDTVICGQPIGQIGSSGCTTGAHLHFETRPLGGASTAAFDPFAGGCSPTRPSLWVNQGPHRGMPGAGCSGGTTADAGSRADAAASRDGGDASGVRDAGDVAGDASDAEAGFVSDGAVGSERAGRVTAGCACSTAGATPRGRGTNGMIALLALVAMRAGRSRRVRLRPTVNP